MMTLIHAACQWGQRSFDGWLIAKARYCLHSSAMPLSYKSVLLKNASRYIRLKTTAYGEGSVPCQSLEIWLVDSCPGQKQAETIQRKELTPPDRTAAITFDQSGLDHFLAASGDTNPIHYGPGAVIPGLWILSRLKELYGSGSIDTDLTIRFLHPVFESQTVLLSRDGNMVTGSIGDTLCFTMSMHSWNQ